MSVRPGRKLGAWPLALVPVLLLAAGVRLLGIGNTDLWGDEAFSVMTAVGPVSHLIGSLMTGEPHPPLYPLLLAGLLRAFGRSEVVARLPSAFAGIASVSVAAVLARSFAPLNSPRLAALAAVVAGLLTALNPFEVWYSQEARMYAQMSFFAGLASLALVRLWQGRRGAGPFYILAVLGAASSHYYGLFVPLAHAITIVVHSRGQTAAIRRWLISVGVIIVGYLPWVVIARQIFFGYYAAQPGTVNLFGIALSAWVRVLVGWSAGWTLALIAAAALTVLVLVGSVAPSRSPTDAFVRTLLIAWVLTPFVGGFLVSLVRPLYAERYLIVASLPMILLVVRGIGWLAVASPSALAQVTSASQVARWRPAAGAAALVAVLVIALGPLYNVWIGRYVKSTYNTHVRDVASLWRPGDAVILDGTSQMPLYSYYSPGQWPTFPLPSALPLDMAKTATQLTQIAQQHSGAWIFLYATPDYDPNYLIPDWLTVHAYRAFDDWAVTGRLQYYRFAADSALTQASTSITFGQAFLLSGYGWLGGPATAGDSVPVAFHWQRLAGAIDHPRMSLRLVDPSGFTWAQVDQDLGDDFAGLLNLPAGQALNDHHALMVPPGTPPGDYRLLLNLYGTGDSHPLAPSGSGAPLDPSGVDLATVHVSQPSTTVWTAGIAGYQPIGAQMGQTLDLLGYAGSDQVTAGDSGYATLIWKAVAESPPYDRLRWQLVTTSGDVAEEHDSPLATLAFPTAKWQTGDVLREQYHVPVSDRLAPGTYRLTVQPISSATGAGPAGAPIMLRSLTVQAGPVPVPDTPPQHPLDDTLGGAVSLVGFDLSPGAKPRPGAPLQISLHWKDLKPVDDDYTVFVHILSPSNQVVAQKDQAPGGGSRPTSAWFAGDTIRDDYDLSLPASLPPGAYPVEVGLYKASDGTRLPVTVDGKAAGDRIILTTLEVAG